MMRNIYSTHLPPRSKAVAYVDELPDWFLLDFGRDPVGGCHIISQIYVPAAHRGFGHGSDLLRQIVDDADAEMITLALEIIPFGNLKYDQLQSWYESFGFEWVEDNLFLREPDA